MIEIQFFPIFHFYVKLFLLLFSGFFSTPPASNWFNGGIYNFKFSIFWKKVFRLFPAICSDNGKSFYRIFVAWRKNHYHRHALGKDINVFTFKLIPSIKCTYAFFYFIPFHKDPFIFNEWFEGKKCVGKFIEFGW